MAQRKIVVGALAGSITVIATWMLKEFVGVEMPVEVSQSVTVLVSALVSWVTPDNMEG